MRRCGGDETDGESVHNNAAIMKVGGGGGCTGLVQDVSVHNGDLEQQ